jgi:hypothetical protein
MFVSIHYKSLTFCLQMQSLKCTELEPCSYQWVWNLVFHIMGRTQIECVWEWDAEENIICALHQKLLGDHIRDDEIHGACSMYGRDNICILKSAKRIRSVDNNICTLKRSRLWGHGLEWDHGRI